MEVTYSGATPPAGSGNYIGDVTLTDTTAITGATINGESATWNNATQTITGDPSTTLAGYQVQYSGPVPGPTGSYSVGSINLTGVTEVTGGSIGGVAGTWNNATQELTGAGVFAGTVLSYTGAPMAGTVGQFIVNETTTVSGATLNGEAATYNAATGEITGDPATTLAGYVIDYAGPAPGPTGSYTVGSVDVAVTPTTVLSTMTVGGLATTVSGDTATVTAGALTGTALEYTGGPLAGYAGDFVVPGGDANLISGIEDALEEVWALQGRIGAQVNRFQFATNGVENKILAMRTAESTIRDLDYAREVSKLTKAAITRTYATAMMAQANAATSTILGLLGGKAQVRRLGGAGSAASASPTMGFTPGFSGAF